MYRIPLALALLGSSLALAIAEDAQHRDGWVVLPVEEYKALRAKANPLPPQPESPPVAATLTRADYEFTVSGEFAEGEAHLTLDVFKEGWAKVPIPSGFLVRGATLDGRPVLLAEGGGPVTAGAHPLGAAPEPPPPNAKAGKALQPRLIFLPKNGRALLNLEVALPIVLASGTESLSLTASDAVISRVVLNV